MIGPTNPRFQDRVALVTGGGSGIGRATALALAAEGATVVVTGRRREPLAETVTLIENSGGRAGARIADISSTDDVARLIADTVTRYGGLHVAVNNAGAFAAGPVADLDETLWGELVATNLTGAFLCLKHEIAHMRVHGGGAIVNVASNQGAHVRSAGLGAYGATKAAVSVLTRAAAREAIADGVRINAVSPGSSETPMSLRPSETPADRAVRLRSAVPIGRVGRLDEVTAAVLWLASDESSFVVGHDLVVDGGATA